MEALVITPELEAAAQRLAERTGTTPTEAVVGALRNESARIEAGPRKDIQMAREILRRIQTLPVDMSLSEDEIVGYDEFGVPEQPHLGR